MNYVSTHTYDDQELRWTLPDPAMQFSNPYLGIGNNPVMYVDPDGRLIFFVVPHIGMYGNSFEIGLTVGIGFPGAKSVQATVGHSFQEGADNTYVSVGASAGGVTASVGYGSQSGFFAGAGLGFGEGGFNSSMTSAGVGWSQNGGAGVNGLGMTYGKGGFGVNPGMGYSRGYGWATSTKVDPTAGAIASSDPKEIYLAPDLAEYEIVGLLSPRQRFAKWARNSQKWKTNANYINRSYKYKQSVIPDIHFEVGLEFTAGVQAGGGAKFAGTGPHVEANLGNVELFSLYTGSSTGDRIAYNFIGKNGVYHISQGLDVAGFGPFQSFNTRGSGYFDHNYGFNSGPVGVSNHYSGLSWDWSGSFIIGVRLYGTVSVSHK